MLKNFFNKYKFLFLIIFLGSIFHICFLNLNEILKDADWFAYLQMSYHFKNFNLEAFWTWWFWFFYSFFIAIFDLITFSLDEYLASLFLNIILFWVWAFFLYKISRFFLDKNYSYLVVILCYLSPILLHFNITILSENIYIPLFLWFVYFLLKTKEYKIPLTPFHKGEKSVNWELRKENKKLMKSKHLKLNTKHYFIVSLFLALLYFTRAEAFIYIWSIILIFFFTWKKIFSKTNFINFFKKSFLLVFFFFLIISPYLFHLYTITWEWWLTNKWSANLRQAELRGSEKMDDEGFEQAVWELTDDNHYLKSGFVGGLAYNKWEETKWLKTYILEKPLETFLRISKNQYKLYSSNLPEIISWNAKNLFNSKDSFLYKKYYFFIISIFPVLLVLYWIYNMFKDKKYDFLLIFFSFFIIASLFFTLFFVLNRYFLIFLPLFLVFLVYGIKNINFFKFSNYIRFAIIFWLISFYLLWILTYYNWVKLNDERYEVKKIAWNWLKEELRKNLPKPLYKGKTYWELRNIRIMERFPITTYYAWTKQRWLTPYTDNLENLIEYARFNKIDYFVVDSLDFQTYRPKLSFLLDGNYKNTLLHKEKVFQANWQKLILYKFVY